MAYKLASALLAGLLIGTSTIGATAAVAQDSQGSRDPQGTEDTASQRGYDQSAPGDPSDQRYDSRDQGGDVPPPPPPPNYDGSQLPPPPPGYRDDPAYRGDTEQDRRYEAYAEDWSQRYCVKSRNNTGTGAVIGGIFGALLGSGLSGRHDHGNGALLGGLAGAAGGAVVGSASSNATSPGCPPGFVVRNDAPTFVYAGEGDPYYYAAPDWYRPWYFYEGRWAYRPYPYHTYYYRAYGRGGYGGYGGYGRGRGGPRDGRRDHY